MNRSNARPSVQMRHPRRGKAPLTLMVCSGIAVVALLAGGAGMHAAGMLTPPPRLDKETLCPSGVPTTQASFMLIDVTDPLSRAEIERVKNRAHLVAGDLDHFGLLTVAALNPMDAASPRIVFRRCAPLSPSRASWITAGEQVLRTEWDKRFERPLMEAIDEATASDAKAERSPIIATVTAITQRPDFDTSVQSRKLILVSDMLEFNPRGYSHMQGGDLAGTFRRSQLAQAWPDLKRVLVTVQYVQRQEPLFARVQTPEHRKFWDWYFRTAGAAQVTFLGVTETPALPPLPPVAAKPANRPPPSPPNLVSRRVSTGFPARGG